MKFFCSCLRTLATVFDAVFLHGSSVLHVVHSAGEGFELGLASGHRVVAADELFLTRYHEQVKEA